MSKVILPGATEPSSKRIFVPRSALPVFRCTVPTGPGEVCGLEFYEGERSRYVDHVARCAHAHDEVIHERSPRTQLPIIHDPNMWDPEYETWMRKVGERMEAEGRTEQRRGEF